MAEYVAGAAVMIQLAAIGCIVKGVFMTVRMIDLRKVQGGRIIVRLATFDHLPAKRRRKHGCQHDEQQQAGKQAGEVRGEPRHGTDYSGICWKMKMVRINLLNGLI